jgi:hypothetical protein
VPDSYCYDNYVVDLLNGYCYKAGPTVTPSYSYNDYQCKFVSYPVLENEQQTKAFLKLLTIGKHLFYEL